MKTRGNCNSQEILEQQNDKNVIFSHIRSSPSGGRRGSNTKSQFSVDHVIIAVHTESCGQERVEESPCS